VTTHYDVLGVPPTAGSDEIRRAYLGLARRHHPDVVAGAAPAARAEAEERMRAANEAWHVLGDPRRRRAYDNGLSAPGAGDPGADAFRPFDTSVDPDPLDAPDVPYRHDPAATGVSRRVATLAPVVLASAAVVAFVLAVILRSGALFGLAVVLLVAAAVGFVVVPLLALARATRDEG
jgi:hypothetical protein